MDDLLTRARAGSRCVGPMVFEVFTPGMAAISVEAGADFILYDMEHSGVGFDVIRAQTSFCRGLSIVPLVRIPVGQYHYIARALDVGAHGIMVPMVESATQARSIVEAAHYPPEGRRGAAFSVAHDHFTGGNVAEKMRAANKRAVVIAQIETERGIDAIDEIAATPGIDVLWLGQFDLSNFLGSPADFTSPAYLAALKRLVGAAKREGKILGILAPDQAWAVTYTNLGFSMLAFGPEHILLRDAVAEGISMLKAI